MYIIMIIIIYDGIIIIITINYNFYKICYSIYYFILCCVCCRKELILNF